MHGLIATVMTGVVAVATTFDDNTIPMHPYAFALSWNNGDRQSCRLNEGSLQLRYKPLPVQRSTSEPS